MVKITGHREHAARLRRMGGPEMERQVGAALLAGGNAIEVEASISITTGSTNAKGQHVRSLPGQPPNEEHGDLRRGLATVQVEVLKVEVQSNARHSLALERGTSKMIERPFLRPATQKKRAEVVQLVRKAVQKIARGGTVVTPKP